MGGTAFSEDSSVATVDGASATSTADPVIVGVVSGAAGIVVIVLVVAVVLKMRARAAAAASFESSA